jgi:hypothetical protein
VKATAFRYITDAITQDEALALLRERQSGKQERTEKVIQQGYPAYTTVRRHHYFAPFARPLAHSLLPWIVLYRASDVSRLSRA